ncbi:MAG: helix-turn-helix domain-containing protein [Firmicutes bacterium]|nr:helix-turn-helix domain-containing protein [Bacillota bacterium]
MIDEKHIGNLIKQIRKRSGLSQRQLATLSGISNTEISNIEANKRRNISPSILSKIASALGITYEKLIKSGVLYQEFKIDNKHTVDFLIVLDESKLDDTVVQAIEMVEIDSEWADIAYLVAKELPQQVRDNLKEYAALLLDKYEKNPHK